MKRAHWNGYIGVATFFALYATASADESSGPTFKFVKLVSHDHICRLQIDKLGDQTFMTGTGVDCTFATSVKVPMTSAALLGIVLSLQIGPTPDPLSSFRVTYEDAHDFGAVNVERAFELAHRLRQKANLPEDQIPRYYRNGLIVGDGNLYVSYGGRVTLVYDRKSGRLFALGVSSASTQKAPNLSLEQCAQKAREYYALAGGTQTLLDDRSFWEDDGQRAHFIFKYGVPGTSYAFEYGVEAIVDRTYGTPNNMQIPAVPAYELPAHVVSAETALAQAAAATILYTGWTGVSPATEEPRLTIPDFRRMPHRMRAVDHRRARERKAAAVYCVTVKDAMAVAATEDKRPFVQVFVDAETGEVLALEPLFLGRGGPSASAKRAFCWSGRDWVLGGLKGKVEDELSTRAPRGKRVLLQTGKTRVLASYDSASGLLWIRDAAGVHPGRPSKSLVPALQRASSTDETRLKLANPAR